MTPKPTTAWAVFGGKKILLFTIRSTKRQAISDWCNSRGDRRWLVSEFKNQNGYTVAKVQITKA